MTGNVLIQSDLHQAIISHRMHAPALSFARFEAEHRFGLRHLKDQDLSRLEGHFRNPVPGLNQGGFCCVRRGLYACRAGNEAADIDRIRGVISPLIDHLQNVIRPDERAGQLQASGSPSVGQGHLTACKRYLIPGDRDRLEDRSANHALGLFVQIRKIKFRVAHDSRAPWSERNRRNNSSSD